MKFNVLLVFFTLIIFILPFSATRAQESDELTFTYSHDGLECGKDGSGSEKENNFKIKGLPKFSDYPAEKNSTKLLEYSQIETHPDQRHNLNIRPDTKYSPNFNGHYFVVSGGATHCTGCAYSEIIDTNTGKKFGHLDIYQGAFSTKFKLNSSLIVENLPEQGEDLCVFYSMPPVVFYQVRNGELIKIKELKLSETEEFKKIRSSTEEGHN